MKKMKILMLTSSTSVGSGVNSFIMNYVNGIAPEKAIVDVVVYRNYEPEEDSLFVNKIEERGGKVYLLPKVSHLRAHVNKCLEILKSGKYDVVHDNSLINTIPMMWCAKKMGIPVRILHSHATRMGEAKLKEYRNKAFLPFLLGLSTDYAACSKAAGTAMFHEKRYTVLPNVISAEHCKYNAEIRELVRKKEGVSDKFVVATVGRAVPQKNPFFALDVIKRASERIENIEYWWIGTGPLLEQIKDYTKQLEMEATVKVMGKRTDMKDLYQAIDCFFLPSLFEGLPLTGVEAQAFGIPSIVSDTVTDEMVYTDLVRFVSLDESIEFWADKIECITKEKKNREVYGLSLKDSVYCDAEAGNNLMMLYNSLVSQKH